MSLQRMLECMACESHAVRCMHCHGMQCGAGMLGDSAARAKGTLQAEDGGGLGHITHDVVYAWSRGVATRQLHAADDAAAESSRPHRRRPRSCSILLTLMHDGHMTKMITAGRGV